MPDKKYVSSFQNDGELLYVKDQEARELIADLAKNGKWLGITSTALTDGATTNPITIDGESVTAKAGDTTAPEGGVEEFIFNGAKWQKFGDHSPFGDLAYTDTASGSFTPTGEIVNTPATANISPVTSVGTLPTVEPTTDSVYSITGVGTLPSLTLSGETLVFNAGTLPTQGAAQTVVTNVGYTAGTLPTLGETQAVLTGVSSAFNGTAGTVTVQANS